MLRDPRAFLWDVVDACDQILGFTRGKSPSDYMADVMLRSAVERQFQIVGEALSQLFRLAPDLAGKVPEVGAIIGFRNVLVHGYSGIGHATAWTTVQERVPPLRAIVDQLLRELGDAPLR